MSDSGRSVGHHHGDLRRAVIEATLSLLREGESAPSLRQAARRAGVSPGAPYHHFKSRQGLMVAVAQEGFQALTSVVQEAAAHEGEPRARVVRSSVPRDGILAVTHRVSFEGVAGSSQAFSRGATRKRCLVSWKP